MKIDFLMYATIAFLMIISCPKQVLAQDDNEPFEFNAMEKPPSFPGGLAKFYEHLGNNIKYPKKAMKNRVQGTVKVSFVVEKDGSITDINVEQRLGFGLDEEAIRVVKRSPKWLPGIQNGKTIRVKYSIPIKFSLN